MSQNEGETSLPKSKWKLNLLRKLNFGIVWRTRKTLSSVVPFETHFPFVHTFVTFFFSTFHVRLNDDLGLGLKLSVVIKISFPFAFKYRSKMKSNTTTKRNDINDIHTFFLLIFIVQFLSQQKQSIISWIAFLW